MLSAFLRVVDRFQPLNGFVADVGNCMALGVKCGFERGSESSCCSHEILMDGGGSQAVPGHVVQVVYVEGPIIHLHGAVRNGEIEHGCNPPSGDLCVEKFFRKSTIAVKLYLK